MDFWIRAAQLILSLSILIVLHEFGHFIPARLFKIRVEKFYLFFNPWFSLFKKKIGDTEWGLGWLPFGGYVKISGMVDESMDTEQLAQPVQPWEFRSKPAWQRLIVMIGGVTVNLVLGFLIYCCVVFVYGEDKLNPKDLKSGITVTPHLAKYGIVSGDNILKINDEPLTNISDIPAIIMLRGGRKLDVLKADGTHKIVQLPENIDKELFQKDAMSITGIRGKGVIVGAIDQKSPAEKATLKTKDEIIAINEKPVVFTDDLQAILFHEKGKRVAIKVLRKNKTLSLSVNIPANGKYEGKMGVRINANELIDEKSVKHFSYSLGESIKYGFIKGKNTLSDYVSQFKFVFTKKGASSIGGFATIGSLFPPTWDWQIFWQLTAFLSIVLAFMNILPIPALDGGHIVFLLYEMITGREAHQKVLEYAQYVGIFIVLGLLLYSNGNDLFHWLQTKFG